MYHNGTVYASHAYLCLMQHAWDYAWLKLVPISNFRYKEEDIGNDNEGVVSDENDNEAVEERERTATVVRTSTQQRRKKLRVSPEFLRNK